MKALIASAEPELAWPEGHPAERPSWRCRVCNVPWPCQPAIVALAVELGTGSAFDLRCWSYYDVAVADLRFSDGPSLIRRFIHDARSALPVEFGS